MNHRACSIDHKNIGYGPDNMVYETIVDTLWVALITEPSIVASLDRSIVGLVAGP